MNNELIDDDGDFQCYSPDPFDQPIVLTRDAFDEFVKVCNNPPQPSDLAIDTAMWYKIISTKDGDITYLTMDEPPPSRKDYNENGMRLKQ